MKTIYFIVQCRFIFIYRRDKTNYFASLSYILLSISIYIYVSVLASVAASLVVSWILNMDNLFGFIPLFLLFYLPYIYYYYKRHSLFMYNTIENIIDVFYNNRKQIVNLNLDSDNYIRSRSTVVFNLKNKRYY